MAGKTHTLFLSLSLSEAQFLLVLHHSLAFSVICSLSLGQYTSVNETSVTAKTHATLHSCVYSPAPHGEIRYGIKIRAKHFSIFEELISKSVQSVQRDENICSRHPVLQRESKMREKMHVMKKQKQTCTNYIQIVNTQIHKHCLFNILFILLKHLKCNINQMAGKTIKKH